MLILMLPAKDFMEEIALTLIQQPYIVTITIFITHQGLLVRQTKGNLLPVLVSRLHGVKALQLMVAEVATGTTQEVEAAPMAEPEVLEDINWMRAGEQQLITEGLEEKHWHIAV